MFAVLVKVVGDKVGWNVGCNVRDLVGISMGAAKGRPRRDRIRRSIGLPFHLFERGKQKKFQLLV